MRNWKGLLTRETVQTGDGRVWLAGAMTWLDPPLPLAIQEDQHGMSEPLGIGNITSITRTGNDITATGVIDDATEAGAEIARRMDAGSAPFGAKWGISVDMDDMEVEIIDNSPQSPDEGHGILVASAESNGPRCEEVLWAMLHGARAQKHAQRRHNAIYGAAGDPAPDGEPIFTDATDAVIMRFTRSRIRGASLCPVPAFADCMIELDGAEVAPAEPAPAPVVAAVSYGAPVKPPRDWFHEPEPTDGDDRLVPQYDLDTGDYIGDAVPLTILSTGQVYGHVAPKNRCHIGFSDVCITPPASASSYARFNLFAVECDDGELHEGTGPLVAGCDHAATLGLDMQAARDWYANNGLAWADVTVRPGVYGPWACGALRPTVTDELVRALRGGGISGDWRGERNGLELIACLAVNTPGFTVQRAFAASASPIRIPRALGMIYVTDDRFTVITAPVMTHRHNEAVLAAANGHAPCGCDDEQLKLLRRIDARTAAALNPTLKSQVAARFRRDTPVG